MKHDLQVYSVQDTLSCPLRAQPSNDTMIPSPQVINSTFQSFHGQNMQCHSQVYSVQETQLCLTGTAEVPLGAVYMDQILSEEQLPIKLAGFGHCFRTEAGAGGNHTINQPNRRQIWAVMGTQHWARQTCSEKVMLMRTFFNLAVSMLWIPGGPVLQMTTSYCTYGSCAQNRGSLA